MVKLAFVMKGLFNNRTCMFQALKIILSLFWEFVKWSIQYSSMQQFAVLFSLLMIAWYSYCKRELGLSTRQ